MDIKHQQKAEETLNILETSTDADFQKLVKKYNPGLLQFRKEYGRKKIWKLLFAKRIQKLEKRDKKITEKLKKEARKQRLQEIKEKKEAAQKKKKEERKQKEESKKKKNQERKQKQESKKKNQVSKKKREKKEKPEDYFRVVEGQRAPLTCDAKQDPAKIPERIKNLPCVTRSKLPLRYHQMLIIKQMIERRGLIAVHAPGSGKTLPAVVVTNCFLHASSKLKGVVIITPKSLLHNFQKEMEAYGVKSFQPGLEYFTYQKFFNAALNNPEILTDKCVILDEAHNLANAKGKRSKLICERVKEARKVLLLTATPMKNRITDMNVLIEMVSGKSVKSKARGPTLDELKCWISYYNCPASEHFPTSKEHDILLPMTRDFYNKYYAIQKNEIKNAGIDEDLFGASDKNLAVFFNGIRRATNNLEKSDSPKIQWVMKQLTKGRKTLIYSFFRGSGLDLVSKLLEEKNIPFAEINGSLSALERTRIVKDYNSEKIKILLISKAGGEGLDLKNTDDVIFIDPSWNEGTEEQIQGRAIRYKSHESRPKNQRHVDIYHLQMVKPKSIDKDDKLDSVDVMLRNMQKKKAGIINSFLHEILPYTIEALDCPRDLPIELEEAEFKEEKSVSSVSKKHKKSKKSVSKKSKTKPKPKKRFHKKYKVEDDSGSDTDVSPVMKVKPKKKKKNYIPDDSGSDTDVSPVVIVKPKKKTKKLTEFEKLEKLIGKADDKEFKKLKKMTK